MRQNRRRRGGIYSSSRRFFVRTLADSTLLDAAQHADASIKQHSVNRKTCLYFSYPCKLVVSKTVQWSSIDYGQIDSTRISGSNGFSGRSFHYGTSNFDSRQHCPTSLVRVVVTLTQLSPCSAICANYSSFSVTHRRC
jgi:hypothetical protein